jgi:hypothetical protein
MLTLFDRSQPSWKSDRGGTIRSREELTAALTDLSQGDPRIFEVVSRSGAALQFGLGGPYACAQFSEPIPDMVEARSAWLARTKLPSTPGEIEFMLGGTPTPVAPEYCLSFQEILTILEHFHETAKRHPEFQWDQFC